MSRFLLLSRGLFYMTPPSLYQLVQCRKMRDDFSSVLARQGECPKQAKELAGAISLCFFCLKPVLARRFSSPEQIYRTLTLTKLRKVAQMISMVPHDTTTEFGWNRSFHKEVKKNGRT